MDILTIAVVIGLVLFIGGFALSRKKGGKKKSKASGDTDKGSKGSQVTIIDLVPGTGKAVKNGSTVLFHYVGTLKKSGREFGNTKKKNLAHRLVVGKGESLKAWDVGLVGMKVGGKRKLIVPPEFGYGAEGVPGLIPANSVLEFEVEMVDVL